MSWLASVIDAFKDAKVVVLLGGAAAGAGIFWQDWPLEWISKSGLVVFIACIVMLAWRMCEWLRTRHMDKSNRKILDTYEAGRRGRNLRNALLECRRGKAGNIQDRSMAGSVSSFYQTLMGIGIRTPPPPPGEGAWAPERHILFLEVIAPYLSDGHLGAAREEARKFVEDHKERGDE